LSTEAAMYTLARIEELGLSIWLRESDWGFFTALVIHSLSMGLVVGINIAISLRLLGMANRVPAAMMFRFLPTLWAGLLAIFISGMLLLLAYPAKALTNYVFYIKLLCILGGLLLLNKFHQVVSVQKGILSEPMPASLRAMAALSLLLWAGSIGAGRFLAYTHTTLLASRFF
jgi:hypothetical protein